MSQTVLQIIVGVSQVVTLVAVLVCCVCLWIVRRNLRELRKR